MEFLVVGYPLNEGGGFFYCLFGCHTRAVYYAAS